MHTSYIGAWSHLSKRKKGIGQVLRKYGHYKWNPPTLSSALCVSTVFPPVIKLLIISMSPIKTIIAV